MIVYHGTDAVESVLNGVRFDVPRTRDSGDFGWGFYCTEQRERAARYGKVLAVTVELKNFACIPNPYFLEGLEQTFPRFDVEKLFYSIAFDGHDMLTVGFGSEVASKAVRDGFLAKGWAGIYAVKQQEIVVFDAGAVQSIRRAW